MKPLELVRLKDEHRQDYKGVLPVNERFIYLGDIKQMPGHGVFVVFGSGKVYAGFHSYSFETIPESEV